MSKGLDHEVKNMIESTLLRFIDESYEHSIRHERLKNGPPDCLLNWRKLVELGLLALPFEEHYEGMGASEVDVTEIIEVLAKGLIFEPFIESVLIAGSVLARGENDSEVRFEIEKLLSGREVPVIIGGREGDRNKLICNQISNGYSLSGELSLIQYAEEATVWFLVAYAHDGIPIIFKVNKNQINCQINSYRLMDSRPAADLRFHNIEISNSSIWLQGESANRCLKEISSKAISAYCSEAIGLMKFLLNLTGDYLKTRIQFGVPISTFQALQHRYADMHISYLESRAISREFASSLMINLAEERQEWLKYAAGLVVTKSSSLIGHEAIQMHGGMGVTDELIVSHCNARLVVLTRLIKTWANQSIPLHSEM